MTDYYIVAVEADGDVMATRAVEVRRDGLDITVRTQEASTRKFAFENQGDDDDGISDSARDALLAVLEMPS